MSDLGIHFKTVLSLLIIVNPIGAIPMFIAITAGDAPGKQRRQAQTAALSVIVILLTAAWLGKPLLGLFGIGVPAFRVGGGILILLMAISMMYAKPSGLRQTSAEQAEAVVKENVAVVPLAMPLLAGPGAISATILTAERAKGWVEIATIHLAALVIGVAVYAALRAAAPIARFLGNTGINIATRLMGMMLAATAVEFIAAGVSSLFPALVGGMDAGVARALAP